MASQATIQETTELEEFLSQSLQLSFPSWESKVAILYMLM